MQKLLLIGLVFFLFGCNSTPKMDDYTRHTAMKLNLGKSLPKFYIHQARKIDIRGEYNNDDSAESGHIMYSGAAGFIGLLTQVATHAAISNSVRNGKLSASQLEANKVLTPLAPVIDSLSLNELLFNSNSNSEYDLMSSISEDGESIHINPIFFVAPDFSSISIKNIIWIEKKKSIKGSSKKAKKVRRVRRSKKDNYLYRNLIQVISREYSQEERDKFQLTKDEGFFKAELQRLLHESLVIASREVKGSYTDNSNKMSTFKIAQQLKKSYFRGYQVDSLNNKLVVRNLRSWLIALPSESVD